MEETVSLLPRPEVQNHYAHRPLAWIWPCQRQGPGIVEAPAYL